MSVGVFELPDRLQIASHRLENGMTKRVFNDYENVVIIKLSVLLPIDIANKKFYSMAQSHVFLFVLFLFFFKFHTLLPIKIMAMYETLHKSRKCFVCGLLNIHDSNAAAKAET